MNENVVESDPVDDNTPPVDDGGNGVVPPAEDVTPPADTVPEASSLSSLSSESGEGLGILDGLYELLAKLSELVTGLTDIGGVL